MSDERSPSTASPAPIRWPREASYASISGAGFLKLLLGSDADARSLTPAWDRVKPFEFVELCCFAAKHSSFCAEVRAEGSAGDCASSERSENVRGFRGGRRCERRPRISEMETSQRYTGRMKAVNRASSASCWNLNRNPGQCACRTARRWRDRAIRFRRTSLRMR